MLPDELPRLEFTLRYRDAWDALFDINQQRIRVSAPAGAGMKVGYDGRIVEVQPGTTVDLPLD
jgi:hypothetical protein